MKQFDLKLLCNGEILSELIHFSISQVLEENKSNDIIVEHVKINFDDQKPSTSILSSVNISLNTKGNIKSYSIKCSWKVLGNNSIKLRVIDSSKTFLENIYRVLQSVTIHPPELKGIITSQYSIMSDKGAIIIGSSSLSESDPNITNNNNYSGISCWISNRLITSNTLGLLNQNTAFNNIGNSNNIRADKDAVKINMPFSFGDVSILNEGINAEFTTDGGFSHSNGKVVSNLFSVKGSLHIEIKTMGNQLYVKPTEVNVNELNSDPDSKKWVENELLNKVDSFVADFWKPPSFNVIIGNKKIVQLDFSDVKAKLNHNGLSWTSMIKPIMNPIPNKRPPLSSMISKFKDTKELPSLKDIFYNDVKAGDTFEGGIYSFGLYEPQGKGKITLLEDKKLTVEGSYDIDQQYKDQQIIGNGAFQASLEWDTNVEKWKGHAKIEGTWNEEGDVFLDYIEDDHYSTFAGTISGGGSEYLVTAQTWKEDGEGDNPSYMYCYVTIEPEIGILPSFYIEHILSN